MSPVLLALADRYRNSRAGREGGSADFLTDFRDLLKSAGSEDGDERIRAGDDLRRAVHESGGLLTLDLHSRDSAIIHRVRLKTGGEAWLFQQIGQRAPSLARKKLAGDFRIHATHAVPHPGWRPWLEALSGMALAGKSVLPFERDDPALNAELLRVIPAVLAWPEESLIRYASAVICKDSKRLEVLQARLLQALRAITGDEETTLESFQILQVPRSVLIHGPLVLDLPNGMADFGLLAGPVSISGLDLARAKAIRSTSRAGLTVENEGVFRELAKRNVGILLVHTSFPGAATRFLLERLPEAMSLYHFGDSDPAGFDVLRDLREKTRRSIQAVGMAFRPHADCPPLTPAERKTAERLLDSPLLADVRPILHAMLEAGSKGDFEQESLGAKGLHAILDAIAAKRTRLDDDPAGTLGESIP